MQCATLLLLLVWCALQLVQAVQSRQQRFAPQGDTFPPRWQRGDPILEELLVLLDEVDERVPAGEVIALEPVYRVPRYRSYTRMWAAYRLPRHHVVLADAPHAAEATWAVTFRRRLQGADWHLVATFPEGRLYRRRVR